MHQRVLRALTCSYHGPCSPPGTRSLGCVTHHTEHLPEKPGAATRAGRARAALGEGGLSASSPEGAAVPGPPADGELHRAGSSAAGSSAGQAAPGGAGSWGAVSAPKASLSCFTRRSTLSAGEGRMEDGMSGRAAPCGPPAFPRRPHSPPDAALMGVREMPGVGERGSRSWLVPAAGSAGPG